MRLTLYRVCVQLRGPRSTRQVELDLGSGAVTSVRWDGQEVCCGLAFLGRGSAWETMPTRMSGHPAVTPADDGGWSVTYACTLGEDGGEAEAEAEADVGLEVTITASMGSSGFPELELDAVCTPTAPQLVVARLGFVALHPVALAGHPLRVTHADGTDEAGAFPTLITAEQPFTAIRALAHAVDCGTALEMRFEGEAEWEMEDQRQWCDASFKT